MQSMAVVNLNSVDRVKKFVNIMSKVDNPVEAWNIDGTRVFCASSIISVFSLDFTKPIGVKINTTDEKVAEEFYKEMENLR